MCHFWHIEGSRKGWNSGGSSVKPFVRLPIERYRHFILPLQCLKKRNGCFVSRLLATFDWVFYYLFISFNGSVVTLLENVDEWGFGFCVVQEEGGRVVSPRCIPPPLFCVVQGGGMLSCNTLKESFSFVDEISCLFICFENVSRMSSNSMLLLRMNRGYKMSKTPLPRNIYFML